MSIVSRWESVLLEHIIHWSMTNCSLWKKLFEVCSGLHLYLDFHCSTVLLGTSNLLACPFLFPLDTWEGTSYSSYCIPCWSAAFPLWNHLWEMDFWETSDDDWYWLQLHKCWSSSPANTRVLKSSCFLHPPFPWPNKIGVILKSSSNRCHQYSGT